MDPPPLASEAFARCREAVRERLNTLASTAAASSAPAPAASVESLLRGLLADIDAYDAPQPPPPPPSRRDRRPKARKPPIARCDARVRNRGTYAALSPREQAHFNASRPFVGSTALRRFFNPYNALLAEIVGHRSFAWSDSDS